jgi:hypothetical protein
MAAEPFAFSRISNSTCGWLAYAAVIFGWITIEIREMPDGSRKEILLTILDVNL